MATELYRFYARDSGYITGFRSTGLASPLAYIGEWLRARAIRKKIMPFVPVGTYAALPCRYCASARD